MDSISIPEMVCQKCGEAIRVEDGNACCDCFEVSIYELSIGYLDYPDFWEGMTK